MAKAHCELSVIRYMPNALKGELLNLGIMVRERNVDGGGFADVRFTRDWRRVRCFHPDADLELLQALEAEFRDLLNSGAEGEAIMAKLNSYLSNAILLETPAAVLAESASAELAKLAPMYLETAASARQTLTGARRIRASMQSTFESAGVWPLMRKRIPVAQYTASGDPLKIDCGYKPNGVIKLFQAISLMSDIDSAKSLALSYPDLREAIARTDNAATELTAIVEDNVDPALPAIAYAVGKLRHAQINVRPEAELPHIAAQARQDLRL